MIGLDPRVVTLGAMRIVGGVARNYTPTGIEGTPAEQHRAVEQIVRQALTGVGEEHRDDDYAVLDGYDLNGNLIADYGIRDARAFRFLYRKLNWRVERSDAAEHFQTSRRNRGSDATPA